MDKFKFLKVFCCGALIAPRLWACGPDFTVLLYNRSATLSEPIGLGNARPLLRAPSQVFPGERAARNTPLERTQAEAQGLTPIQAAQLERMRLASSGDVAYALGTALPLAIRLYTAGAVDFLRAQPPSRCQPADKAGACPLNPDARRVMRLARERFQHVLELPTSQRAQRATWAAYMLGRIAAFEGKPRAAAHDFRLTRQLALAGNPDPLALAVASYGEQGRIAIRARQFPLAVALYAQQAAHGAPSAKRSLAVVADTLLALPPAQLKPQLSDPLTLQLVVDDLLLKVDYTLKIGQFDKDLLNKLAYLLPSDYTHADGIDRLAAVAYNGGNYALASQLVARQNTPLAHWVKAKLALYHGHSADAAAEYAQVVRAMPPSDSYLRAHGENSVLSLERGEYSQALAQFLFAGAAYKLDSAYIADRVLTVDELKTFVDSNPQLSQPLRNLLARRLMRNGRYSIAMRYFPPELSTIVSQLRQNLADADSAWTAKSRAQSLYAASLLVRQYGLQLMGTELGPDGAFDEGDFNLFNPIPQANSPQARSELARYLRSAPQPDLRWHYRSTAADLARRAADALPSRTQASAALLCLATSWVLISDPVRAQILYRQYLRDGPYVSWAAHFGKNCPPPDFDRPFNTWLQRYGHRMNFPHAWSLVLRRVNNHPVLAGLALSALLLALFGILHSSRK